MKKYYPELIAIVCAITFNSFTKPFDQITFKLKHDPIVSGIVNNPAEWASNGSYYGACNTSPVDLACAIFLGETRSSYFHIDGGAAVLNTFDYANDQNPKKDFLDIVETTSGIGYNRIIVSITPKHWNPSANSGQGAYEVVSLGACLSFSNARD
jgi:hypothetical protein